MVAEQLRPLWPDARRVTAPQLPAAPAVRIRNGADMLRVELDARRRLIVVQRLARFTPRDPWIPAGLPLELHPETVPVLAVTLEALAAALDGGP